MHIIFGRDHATKLEENYTVLELDTIRLMPSGQEITAFCVVESIPINDMSKLESMRNLHCNLLIEYRKQNWNYCIQALEYLKGFWNRELDTFYDHLQSRIDEYVKNPPDDSWDGKIEKS